MRFTETERERVGSLLALVLQIFKTNALRTDRRNFRYGAVAGSDDAGADTAGANSRPLLMDLALKSFTFAVCLHAPSSRAPFCVRSCVPAYFF